MSAESAPSPLTGTTALVTGASRGLGRGIAAALTGAGASVIGVARDAARLTAVQQDLGDRFTPVSADVTDPVAAGQLLDLHRPGILVLNAGAVPLARPLHQQTWESFSRNWEVDVRQAFYWIREALLRPLPAGSTVIAMSSGAVLHGSPLSGGYAGAKAAVRHIAAYAAAESGRAGLGIRFVSVLPQLTPETDLGAVAVAGYAEREGMTVAEFLAGRGPGLSPEQAGKAILSLVTDPDLDQPAYLLTAAGLTPVA